MASAGSAARSFVILEHRLDLLNGMTCQILGDLGGDSAFDLFVIVFAQLAQSLWGRDDNQTLELIGQRGSIDSLRSLRGETILRLFVEIGLGRGEPRTRTGTAGLLTCLVGFYVTIILIRLLLRGDHGQVRIFGITLIPEEQHLRAVGDEDIAVMGDTHLTRLLFAASSKPTRRRYGGCRVACTRAPRH